MIHFFILSLVLIVMVVGLIGEILPGVPGMSLIWVSALLYGLYDHFEHVGWFTILLIIMLWLIASAMDYISHYLTAKHFEVSWWGLIGAIVGGLIGLIYFQIIGLFVGSFLGSFLGEWLAKRAVLKALKAGSISILAIVLGTVLKISIALLMIFIFITSLII